MKREKKEREEKRIKGYERKEEQVEIGRREKGNHV